MLIAQRPSLGEEQAGDYRSKFTIEPLEPGFGYTIGNSIRRTLLSSIPGAAVTQVLFDDALHEFDTIAGVTEDVTDVILNLKDLVLTSVADEALTLRLDVRGPAEVTAADIQTSADVEILNAEREGLVLMLWGSYAQKKGAIVDRSRHCVLSSPHPSPLSAHRGFFGCRHFSKANRYLVSKGKAPIDWFAVE